MRLALAVAALLFLAGCSVGGSDEGNRPAKPGAGAGKPRAGEPREAVAIRSWLAALNAGRFSKAASFFAEGAIVEQTRELRLRGRADAIAFNRSLPCRAEVTDVDDEGRTIVAAFRLRDGPGGRCEGGSARVRFRFRRGKFVEWRQLARPQGPPGTVA